MPYLLISTLIRLENGPTICGDEWSDKSVMSYLGATLVQSPGNCFKEYSVTCCPRIVLDKLEKIGYVVIATSGVGQAIIWTLHKPKDINEKSTDPENH